jgi:hypothetical protein
MRSLMSAIVLVGVFLTRAVVASEEQTAVTEAFDKLMFQPVTQQNGNPLGLKRFKVTTETVKYLTSLKKNNDTITIDVDGKVNTSNVASGDAEENKASKSRTAVVAALKFLKLKQEEGEAISDQFRFKVTPEAIDYAGARQRLGTVLTVNDAGKVGIERRGE